MRLTNDSFAFSIYRKPVHAGNYLHAYSYQPLSQKSTVIRSLFLRAYRFCDKQFLKEEEDRIKQNFLDLGYTDKFIEKCRASAYKGRMNEVRKGNLLALQELPFASTSITPKEKQEPLATLTLPYHPCMLKLKPRLSEMGIRMAFSSNSSIQQQLRRKPTREQPRGSCYIVSCSACPKVYVGQTGKYVEECMEEHSRDPYETTGGAMHRHNAIPGHVMDLRNPTQVYSSDCYYTRVTVEAALIHIAPTIQHNTASASNNSNDLVAPVICRSTRFDWQKLANCIPSLNIEAVQRSKRHLFGNHDVVRPPANQRSQAAPTPLAHRTRSRLQSRSSAVTLQL